MRGLISPTSQYCRKNVLDTGSGRLDRGRDTAASTLESGSSLERGGPCPCSGSRDNNSSPIDAAAVVCVLEDGSSCFQRSFRARSNRGVAHYPVGSCNP